MGWWGGNNSESSAHVCSGENEWGKVPPTQARTGTQTQGPMYETPRHGSDLSYFCNCVILNPHLPARLWEDEGGRKRNP